MRMKRVLGLAGLMLAGGMLTGCWGNNYNTSGNKTFPPPAGQNAAAAAANNKSSQLGWDRQQKSLGGRQTDSGVKPANATGTADPANSFPPLGNQPAARNQNDLNLNSTPPIQRPAGQTPTMDDPTVRTTTPMGVNRAPSLQQPVTDSIQEPAPPAQSGTPPVPSFSGSIPPPTPAVPSTSVSGAPAPAPVTTTKYLTSAPPTELPGTGAVPVVTQNAVSGKE
jgi:hypothetical protein